MRSHSSIPVTNRAQQLLASGVLPQTVQAILEHRLYAVPRSGLFTTFPAGSSEAFPRYDLVQQLVDECTVEEMYRVLLLFGMRRIGKTFIMAWAIVEAIRRIQEVSIVVACRVCWTSGPWETSQM